MTEFYIQVRYADRALTDALKIKDYLRNKFSEREILRFFKLLKKFEKTVLMFPLIYPISTKNKKMHRAVLSKQLSVFYTRIEDEIIVAAILDNRMGEANWP